MTKRRDKWWGDLLLLALCTALVGPLFAYHVLDFEGFQGWWQRIHFIVVVGISSFLWIHCAWPLVQSLRRRRESLKRWRRLRITRSG